MGQIVIFLEDNVNSMIEKRCVTGELATAYIRNQLSICRMLSDGSNGLFIENGEVYAFVPSWIESDKLYQFKNGGIYVIEAERVPRALRYEYVRNEALTPIAEEMERLIKADKKNCLLFEEPLYDRKYLEKEKGDVAFVSLGDRNVFYFLNGQNADLEKIKEVIVLSENYVFTCAVSTLNENVQSTFLSSKEINAELLDEFVRNVFVFFVGAYDGEGYLMWVKKVE